MPRSGRIILLLLLLLWGYGVYRLGTLWQGDSDYSYGWFVPLLCVALFAERWPGRPPAEAPRFRAGIFILFAGLGLTLLAGAIFLEVLPIWRLAAWIFAGSVAGLTLMGLYLWGGGNWTRHLAFPVLFLLVAVPWPSVFEKPLIYDLSHLNATLSAWTANCLGIPCLRQGTLIQTGSGPVGVEDACSGIRSLQATVMVALFLGELFRYSFFRRMVMLFAGLGLAFLGNVVRTTYLVRACDLHGPAGVNLWHDEAGFAILAVTLVGLLGLAWGLHPRSAATAIARGMAKGSSPHDQPLMVAPPASPRPPQRAIEPDTGCAIPVLMGLLIVIGLFELGMERWFDAGEKKLDQTAPWTFVMPVNSAGYTEMPIPDVTRSILNYDQGTSAQWHDEQSRPWQLFYFRWLATRSHYRAAEVNVAARAHTPDLCLKNAGMILQTNFGTVILEIKGVRIQVTIERFLDNERPVDVLSGYWEPDSTDLRNGPRKHPTTSLGLQTAVQAIENQNRGHGEKRVIEIGVWDMDTEEEARAALKSCLQAAIAR